MVQIIKPGHNDPSWSGEVQCRGTVDHQPGGCQDAIMGCGAILAVTKAAFFRIRIHSMRLDSGGQQMVTQFRCPACGVATNVAPNTFFFKDLPVR